MITIQDPEIRRVWVPLKPAETIYMGSIVAVDSSALDEGVITRIVTSQGINDTGNKDRPLGVAIGHNLINPVFSSTYLAEYITDEGATSIRASTTKYRAIPGAYPFEGRAMVEIALITPSTLLRAPIRNAAITANVRVLTSTAGNSNGLTVTTNAAEFTPVANLCTVYCRSGKNAGQYRITNDTSTTVAAWDVQMLQTTATTGETYVRVPMRTNGASRVAIGDGTVSSFIDSSAGLVTDYDIIHVTKLDLMEAGNEYVEFYLDGDIFATVRA